MDEVGPLQILYSWQSLLLAIAITIGTQGVKRLVDSFMGGTDTRKQRRYMSTVVLPAVPLALGTLAGMFVPLRPELLMEYVRTHDVSMYWVGGAYGLAVGQFADYLYQRFANKRDPVPVPDQGET